MRYIIFLCAFAPALVFAQDCRLKKSTDPFTHETRVSTGFMAFHKGMLKLSVSIDATPALVDFFFWIRNDSRCFDDASYAEVVFEGEKSKTRLKNTGSMNCEGAFHFSFRNAAIPNSQLNKIATKKISSITLVGSNKTETFITLTEDQKLQLMQAAACVVAEAIKLVKQ